MSTPESLHIVCPHCHTTNRVQFDQLTNAPDCGSCHQPLFVGAPLELDAVQLGEAVVTIPDLIGLEQKLADAGLI